MPIWGARVGDPTPHLVDRGHSSGRRHYRRGVDAGVPPVLDLRGITAVVASRLPLACGPGFPAVGPVGLCVDRDTAASAACRTVGVAPSAALPRPGCVAC